MKIIERMLFGLAEVPGEQVVLLSQARAHLAAVFSTAFVALCCGIASSEPPGEREHTHRGFQCPHSEKASPRSLPSPLTTLSVSVGFVAGSGGGLHRRIRRHVQLPGAHSGQAVVSADRVSPVMHTRVEECPSRPQASSLQPATARKKHSKRRVLCLPLNIAALCCSASLHAQVLTFNGERVRSLSGLAEAVSECDGPFLRFGLDNGETVVLDHAEVRFLGSAPIPPRVPHPTLER